MKAHIISTALLSLRRLINTKVDKQVGKMIEKTMGAGEKKAPVKSIKLKVKFQKSAKDKCLKDRIKDEE